tara:strand:+ start:340 stop:1176 length:837 start_codon:yes stop_codon:yes gene_type:complete
MANFSFNSKKIDFLVSVSKNAGRAIMDIYKTDFDIEIKDDNSPLTKADTASNEIIHQALKQMAPGIPILSEESSEISYSTRSKWNEYWLVDPLDGTKEFIDRNGEFTTNIALIRNGRPVFGIIHAPSKNETYWGSNEFGSYCLKEGSVYNAKKLSISKQKRDRYTILTSRSHPSRKLEILLEKINHDAIVRAGSSLKFCLLAEGKANLYLRLGPTSEWDIAAGDAILSYAGGSICDLEGNPILYNKNESLLNPNFLAINDKINQEKILGIINECLNDN